MSIDPNRSLDAKIIAAAKECRPLAVELLREAVRIPADYVDLPAAEGGDPSCGLSNHEGPRLEYFRRKIVELGAVDGPEDVRYDDFGNLWWTVQDPDDGVPADEKTVVYLDGHTDTVQALRPRWLDAIGGGIDAYDGLVSDSGIDRSFLEDELGHLPPSEEWNQLLWGRGSADQLGGVVCQILATKVLLQLRSEGALAGIVVHSYGTVAEEDNDGGGPMFIVRKDLPGAGVDRIPDVVILTEGTGCSQKGALGIYRGQRGRMQIEVEVVGKSCHGSMPWEGRNPLEFGGAIIAEAAEQYARGESFADDSFLGPGTRTASMSTLDTPSDCAVPERFTFRFDRRLTAGEDPQEAVQAVESLSAVATAREAGLEVSVRVPTYDRPTWRGYVPGNPQIYPGWVTPEDDPAIEAAVAGYKRVIAPQVANEGSGGGLRRAPRVSRWVFSTDGVGVPIDRETLPVPESKGWLTSGRLHYPAMLGLGPGIEQNTHKIGECVDTRELAPVIAFYARFPTLYRQLKRAQP